MKFIMNNNGTEAVNVNYLRKIYIDGQAQRDAAWVVVGNTDDNTDVCLKYFGDSTATENHAAAKEYFDDLIKQLEG